MFADDPLPVPAEALAAPELADKVGAYLSPFRELTARGVPAVRFPAPLRELEAVPELLAMLGDPDIGFAGYERRVGVTSARAADAVAGLARARFDQLSAIVTPRLAQLRDAEGSAREVLAVKIDVALRPAEREALQRWNWESFINGCIARLCRAVKIDPLEPTSYSQAIDSLAEQWGDDPHDRIACALAEDRSVPAALVRMFLHSMSFRLLEDSGTITRQAESASGLRRVFGSNGGTGIEQSRRIVTDAGVLHCEARVGARVEISVDLEPSDGARRTRLMHLSHRQGPDMMAGIEAHLRRAIEQPAPERTGRRA